MKYDIDNFERIVRTVCEKRNITVTPSTIEKIYQMTFENIDDAVIFKSLEKSISDLEFMRKRGATI